MEVHSICVVHLCGNNSGVAVTLYLDELIEEQAMSTHSEQREKNGRTDLLLRRFLCPPKKHKH